MVNSTYVDPVKDFFDRYGLRVAILLLIGVILYTMKGAGGAMGGKNPMSFGKSKAT
jgi:cell division protease FtsH